MKLGKKIQHNISKTMPVMRPKKYRDTQSEYPYRHVYVKVIYTASGEPLTCQGQTHLSDMKIASADNVSCL